ncbi:enoyl-CoA hydratase/isomerase family protein [Variovorax sp. PBS-H4]|uniref:enoyl-CoA hydratase/isomerase family protein n=1 Tax=Variovorax sp. PBS-H4 TaxID=434008 RepID=UPI001E60C675|nr:enoyl-CoA hydratase/isomerase family protein [Variovorax sp. PBS-H4]
MSVESTVATLELARPDKLNSLNDQILIDMQNALDALEGDADVRVVIITGQGRAFCAGFDLSPREKPFTTVQDWREHVKLGNETWWRIWKSRMPVIAAVNGFALGGGCDLSMVCDYTLASEAAVFGEPEIQFQSAPPFNITPWILGMKSAKEFLLFGDRVNAEDAVRLGLANRVVPADQLRAEAMKTALRLAKLPPPSVELNKLGLNRSYELRGFQPAIEYGAEIFTQVLMSESAEAKEFFERMNRDGLKAAFKWRDERFAVPEFRSKPAATLAATQSEEIQ